MAKNEWNSFTDGWTVLLRSEIKRENSVTMSPLVEQKLFVAFYTGLFTPRGAKKHAGQNTDYLAGLLRAWWKLD